MNDIVLGLLAILIGTVFCFRGYFAMRIIIPIWGAFAGFVLGAGLVSVGGDEFLSTVLSWVVGIAVAVVFGLIAYLYYEVAVFIGMTSIGFILGTTAMAALGVTWSWLIILVGVISAAVLAFIAIIGDMPMVLLTVLTGLAGASAITGGLMLMFGVIDTDGFDSTVTTESAANDWWWYAIYAALAIAGIISQIRENDLQQASLRAAWRGVDEPAT
ncbi:MAG: DUF4203 domain-containing protein [Ilumatobacteraceae bacterium]